MKSILTIGEIMATDKGDGFLEPQSGWPLPVRRASDLHRSGREVWSAGRDNLLRLHN